MSEIELSPQELQAGKVLLKLNGSVSRSPVDPTSMYSSKCFSESSRFVLIDNNENKVFTMSFCCILQVGVQFL